jgi:hypothetical protein
MLPVSAEFHDFCVPPWNWRKCLRHWQDAGYSQVDLHTKVTPQ